MAIAKMGVSSSEEVAMRRTYFLIVVVFGMATATFAQTTSSDTQTLPAILSEVRQLRQDLRVSLSRMESAQILLSRLQIEQVAVSRASQHLDDARTKLAEVQVVIRSETAEIKHYEDAPSNGENTALAEAALNRAKSDLEASTNLAQQRQSIEADAELQLRTEQDKLNKLESLLDQIVEKIGSPHE
jgi:isoleucyl-tRNA synthetase